MLNDNFKNTNTQLPNQVEAVNQLKKLFEDYFNLNGLEEINQLLIALAGAATSPDLHPRRHKRMAIANAFFHIRNTITLFSKAKILFNTPPFDQYTENNNHQLGAVARFDVDYLTNLLFSCLEAYTYQDKGFEGATLAYSLEITAAFKLIYDWLSNCEAWLGELKLEQNLVLA